MIGTELDGRYRIEAELGSGGAGTVYRALYLERNTAVAVKVLRPELASSAELRQRFAREARALTAVSHPNIVAVVDSGVAADTAYLVMEMLEGETLSARLKRGPLSVEAALAVMRQLLSALAFVHEQGLVHRDVKPANIFLQADGTMIGRVRLLDFGLAKFLAPEAGGVSLTRAGQVFGTPAYMAPEQIAGQQADPRTDVYTLGIVLFEMLTGRVPFTGDASEVLRRHIMEDLPLETALPPGVPPAVVRVLKTATAKTRAGRYASAREMLEELNRAAPEPEPASSEVATAKVGQGLDAFAPTLSLEQATVASPPAPPSREPSAPPAAPPQKAPTLWSRMMRLGATVAILVSLAAAAIAAACIYVLVTPGREDERRAIEDALGLPSASASSAAFHPTTLRSPKAWPSASEQGTPPAAPPFADNAPPLPVATAAASAPLPESPASAPSESSAIAERAPEPTPPAPSADLHPKGPVPENPWLSTPGELFRLMGRANRTRGFDKHDMRDLHQYNAKHPTDPRGHLLLARGYLTRRWVKDAANEFAIALKVNDSARGDPHLLSDLIRVVQLGSDEGEHLVMDVFGASAVPAVERALVSQGRPEVKARLERLRAELGGK